MYNPETMVALRTQETGQISVRENPHGKFNTRYNTRDGISSTVVNVPGFDGDVPLDPPYGVYISQLLSLED
jgi:hypothetical protein